MQQTRATSSIVEESREPGQALTEYAIIVGVLSIVAILVLNALGGAVLDLYERAGLLF